MTAMSKEEVLAVLDASSEKLGLYYGRVPEYVGGMEHSWLQRQITAARATVEALWEERERLAKENAVLHEAFDKAGLLTDGHVEEYAALKDLATRAEAALKEAGAWRPIAEVDSLSHDRDGYSGPCAVLLPIDITRPGPFIRQGRYDMAAGAFVCTSTGHTLRDAVAFSPPVWPTPPQQGAGT